MGTVTYTDNRSFSPADDAKLKELFASLLQQIDAAPNATPEAKADAKGAAQALQEEVDATKRDPNHKPDRWKMKELKHNATFCAGQSLLEMSTLTFGNIPHW